MVRYETNTVWTSSATSKGDVVTDELKNKNQNDSKPGKVVDNRTQSGNEAVVNNATNSAPVQTQTDDMALGAKTEVKAESAPMKQAEVLTAVQKVNQGPVTKKVSHKKFRKTRAKSMAAYDPSTERAGYAYYAQSGTRGFVSPVFVGGDAALQQYVKDNLRISSPDKKGTIVADFQVNKDGSVDTASVKITTAIKDCNPCSKDVIELVKKMPKWTPATENGQPKEYRQKMSVIYDVNMSKK